LLAWIDAFGCPGERPPDHDDGDHRPGSCSGALLVAHARIVAVAAGDRIPGIRSPAPWWHGKIFAKPGINSPTKLAQALPPED